MSTNSNGFLVPLCNLPNWERERNGHLLRGSWPGATHSANRISTPVLQIRTKVCKDQHLNPAPSNCKARTVTQFSLHTSEMLDDEMKAAD